MDPVNPFVDIFPPCFDDIIAPILVCAVGGRLQTPTQFAQTELEQTIRGDVRSLLKLCRRVATIQLVSKKFFKLLQPSMHIISAGIETKASPTTVNRDVRYYLDDLSCGMRADIAFDLVAVGAFGEALRRCSLNAKNVGSLCTARSLETEYRNGPRGIEMYSTVRCKELTYRKNKDIIEFVVKHDGDILFSATFTYHNNLYTYITRYHHSIIHKTFDGKRATITRDDILIANATPTTLNTYYWPSGKKEIVVDEKSVQKYAENGDLLIYYQKSDSSTLTITAIARAIGQNVDLHPCKYMKCGLWP